MNPPLCEGGCGFYGSAATNNLCSKCYKAFLKKLDEEQEEAANDVVPVPSRTSKHDSYEEFSSNLRVQVDRDSVQSDSGGGTKKRRCRCCNKKVGLLGFECRCSGGTFCSIHRYPETHGCNYDFKTRGRDALEKANPLCMADKLDSRI